MTRSSLHNPAAIAFHLRSSDRILIDFISACSFQTEGMSLRISKHKLSRTAF
ncbi:MAG: hypothetical protein AAGD25_14930 [Cyanobacteria bacterium P01_F01_bin.150]